MHRLIVAFAVVALSCGCATPVSYSVRSEPSGCPVDVEGAYVGTTPTTIRLSPPRWVGLMRAPGGWVGQESYAVTCYPPPDATEELDSQTKILSARPQHNGTEVFFDLRLQSVLPTERIEISKDERSEMILKDELTPSRVAPGGDGDVAEKLRTLLQLQEEGLITEQEYRAKRKAIIDGL